MQVPAPFEYERATSVDHALALLERHGPEARLIAGGHSLLPMMKLRLARPEMLIDINDLTDLDYIRLDGGEIAIGAMTRHVSILDVGRCSPSTTASSPRPSGSSPIRSCATAGTIGGSFCQADPSEDLSAVGSALRATMVIRSSAGTRTVAAREFHDGPYQTLVGPAEMLVEIRVPIRPGVGSAYEKVERRAGDWAIAAAGTFVQLDGDVVADCGIGLTAVGADHFTCAAAEDHLRGKPASAENLAAAGQICHDAVDPSADQRGPVDYKRHLARELVTRALTRSAARAGGDDA